MADFAAVLKKTLDKMGETTPEIRQKVYEKARETIKRQIDAMEKAPPQAAVDRQFAKLDDAISEIEGQYAAPVDDLDLDDLLSDVVAEEPAAIEPVEEAVAEVQPEPAPEPAPAPEPEPEVAAEAAPDPEIVTEPEPALEPETAAEPVVESEAEADSVLDALAEVAPAAAVAGGGKIAEIKARARANAAKTEADVEVDPVAGDVVPDLDPKMPEASTDPLENFLHDQAASADDAAASVDTAIGDLKDAASTKSDDVLGEITAGARGAANDAGASIDDLVAGAPGALGMPEEKPRSGGLIKSLLALAVIGGGGYFAYANQDTLKTRWSEQVVPWWQNLTGGDDASSTNVGQSDGDVPVRTVTTTTIENSGGASDSEPEEAPTEITDVSGSEPQVKFTQRLTEDGTEIDDGPVDGASNEAGEGSSVAPQTPGTANEAAGEPETEGDNTEVAEETPAAVETPAVEPSTPTPVGQRAIFYEERTGASDGTALAGATIWSIVNESPGGDLPVEPAIRAETTVPELGIQMEMTIRRNGDDTFPASHIIELFFRVPDTFEGRGIADVQRITFKTNEQDPGNALIAVPAPLDQNIFLVALTDAATAIETNTQLMRRENWIDIPMQYTSGRRALITFEKGIPGERVFNDVFAAWDASPIN